ncbi:MAG: Asp23/Gls24 family envelope stress response protein [Candidatus Omnitrophota bacterium]
MSQFSKVDLGSIKIHKKVIADIAANALQDIKGIKVEDKSVLSQGLSLFGIRKHPGVSVSVDASSQVVVDVAVWIEYGLSIPEVAARAQDAVREAIEQTVDIDLKDININIQGIERGQE